MKKAKASTEDLIEVVAFAPKDGVNPAKVFRVNGVVMKHPLFKDQQKLLTEKLQAALLGLSFDELLSKKYDLHVENFLNTKPEGIEQFDLNTKNDMWKGAYLHRHTDEDGTQLFRIYRFRGGKTKSSPSGVRFYRFNPEKLEVRLQLPPGLHSAFFKKKPKRDKEISRHLLLRKLFTLFLQANEIESPTAKYDSPEYFNELAKILDKIAKIEIWKPYEWMSPPIRHSPTELRKEFLHFCLLDPKNSVSFTDRRFDKKTARTGAVVFHFNPFFDGKVERRPFDPIGDLLPYISQRLWRNPNGFFSILLLQFLRENQLYDIALDQVADDFEEKIFEFLSRTPAR